jgi:hypothetical protein
LHKIFEQYGEVTNAKTLAKKIVEVRSSSSLKTIDGLKNALREIVKGNPNKYFAQVFQALRIEVNDEMGALKEMLQQVPPLLKPAGRVAIITFHSLEDRIVKNFFRKGNFEEDTSALPKNYTSKLCVRAFDYNNDGKPDLFISGRVEPWHYPKPVSSYILRNDSKDGKAKFTDVTDEVAPGLKNIGLVCDALFTDFDNDGYRDLVVTNGFPRDVTDHDFIAYRKQSVLPSSSKELLDQIPQVKLHNYAYKNKGDLTFSDETVSWGLEQPTFSNGAAYADFDNDGALDMVINNINDQALLYRNTSRDKDSTTNHYLQIKFKGDKQNINGLGADVSIFYDHGKQQVYDNNPYRGYLSSMQGLAHFGLNNIPVLDSVVIKWYNGKLQKLENVHSNQVITVDIANAGIPDTYEQPPIATNALFKEISHNAGINYRHKEYNFIDFDIQHLLPHKLSEYGPGLAAGDLDGAQFVGAAAGRLAPRCRTRRGSRSSALSSAVSEQRSLQCTSAQTLRFTA